MDSIEREHDCDLFVSHFRKLLPVYDIINYRGALIKRKLKKVDPFHSITFARWAQEQFVEIFSAVQK